MPVKNSCSCWRAVHAGQVEDHFGSSQGVLQVFPTRILIDFHELHGLHAAQCGTQIASHEPAGTGHQDVAHVLPRLGCGLHTFHLFIPQRLLHAVYLQQQLAHVFDLQSVRVVRIIIFFQGHFTSPLAEVGRVVQIAIVGRHPIIAPEIFGRAQLFARQQGFVKLLAVSGADNPDRVGGVEQFFESESKGLYGAAGAFCTKISPGSPCVNA